MNMNEARLLTLIEVIQIALTVHQDSIVWREAPLDSDRHNIGDVNIGWGMPMVMNNSIVFYEFGTEDEDVCRSVAEKAMVIGYTRILRRSARRPHEPGSAEMVAHCKKRLSELLEKTDTLVF